KTGARHEPSDREILVASSSEAGTERPGRRPRAGVVSDAIDRLKTAGEKAHILADALPYIREFTGKTVVVKYGGHAMDDPALAELFATDVVLMRLGGLNPRIRAACGPP